MPVVDPIAKSDQALTSTSAGDMLKSTGPSGVPTVAVASTDYSVPAADETIDGVKTHTATLVTNTDALANFATGTGQIQRYDMPDDVSAPFCLTVWSFPTDDPDGRMNHPVYWGHNAGKGGQPVDGTQPSCGIGLESHYIQYSPTVGQFECHFGVTQFVNGHNQIRPVSAVIMKDGSFCTLLFTADNLSFQTGDATQEISINWPEISFLGTNYLIHATNNVRWLQQVNSLGSAVSLLYLDSSNTIHIGDSGYSSVSVAIDNPLSSITLKNGAAIFWKDSLGNLVAFLQIDTSNNTHTNPPGNSYHTTPDAKFTQFRAHTGNPYWRYDDNTGLTLGGVGVTDGTEKLSFHGASPKARQTITGNCGGIQALKDFFTAMNAKGLVVDSTTLSSGLGTATDGATVTFDLATHNDWQVTLGGNRTLAVSGAATNQQFTIFLTQDGAGSRTVTWWGGIRWASGVVPTLTTTAGKIDTFTFRHLGSGVYLGYVAGRDQ